MKLYPLRHHVSPLASSNGIPNLTSDNIRLLFTFHCFHMIILIRKRNFSSIRIHAPFILPILKSFTQPLISWFNFLIRSSSDRLQLRFVSFFNFLWNLVTDSRCGRPSHFLLLESLSNPNPQNFSFIGRLTRLFSIFTRNPSFSVMNRLTDFMTRCAAFSLFVNINASSA